MDAFIGHIDIDPALDPDELDDLPARAHWTRCRYGCCLLPGSTASIDESVAELRLVIDELRAEHRCSGTVVGHAPDDGRLVAVTVTTNRVTQRTLRPGPPGPGGRHEPCEQDLADRARRRGSARRTRSGAVVIDLASRRA